MSFKSVLAKIGADVKEVFAYIGSPQGQAVIAAGEGVVETVAPQLTGVINLANGFITEAAKTEALAAAAGAQTGSGVQKLNAVVAAVTPQVLAFAKSNGLPTPTSATIQAAANGIVAFLNALEAAPVA